MGLTQKEDFQALAVTTVFLFFKMLFCGVYTGYSRGREKKFASPEVTNNSN